MQIFLTKFLRLSSLLNYYYHHHYHYYYYYYHYYLGFFIETPIVTHIY
jgi:hypothetical protein